MKKLLSIIAVAAVMLFFAQDTFAQTKMKRKGTVKPTKTLTSAQSFISPSQKANDQTAKLANKLDLSRMQADQVYQINLQAAEQMNSLKSTRARDVQTFKNGVKKIYKDKNAAIQSVLTNDQKVNYSNMKAKMKENRINN